MQKLPFSDCLKLLDEKVWSELRDSLANYNSNGVLIFENGDLSSSYLGCRFAIGYGPNNTIHDIPHSGKCEIQPPLGHSWQYHLKAYSIGFQ